jgi:hypothetical protein
MTAGTFLQALTPNDAAGRALAEEVEARQAARRRLLHEQLDAPPQRVSGRAQAAPLDVPVLQVRRDRGLHRLSASCT